jgi:hypothetical protein
MDTVDEHVQINQETEKKKKLKTERKPGNRATKSKSMKMERVKREEHNAKEKK